MRSNRITSATDSSEVEAARSPFAPRMRRSWSKSPGDRAGSLGTRDAAAKSVRPTACCSFQNAVFARSRPGKTADEALWNARGSGVRVISRSGRQTRYPPVASASKSSPTVASRSPIGSPGFKPIKAVAPASKWNAPRPKCPAHPPSFVWASSNPTRSPDFRASAAVAKPPIPPPTTSKSKISSIGRVHEMHRHVGCMKCTNLRPITPPV